MKAEELVAKIRRAAAGENPYEAVRSCLEEVAVDPDNPQDLALDEGEDEIMYFEDDKISIWNCRFFADKVIPPHEHKMAVHIANIAGVEKNLLFRQQDDGLTHVATVTAAAGEVISLDADVIHAVGTEGAANSQAIHVYFGSLSKIQRGVFDWDSGEKLDFSDENFKRLIRAKADMPEF